jgi:hypothetical protein
MGVLANFVSTTEAVDKVVFKAADDSFGGVAVMNVRGY